MRPSLVLLLMMFFLSQCSLVRSQEYEDKDLGWKMPKPSGSVIMLEKHLDDYNHYPNPALYDKSGKQLLDLYLAGKTNSLFMAILTRFDKTAGNWEMSRREKDLEYFNGLMNNTGGEGKCDSTTYNEKIGGALFRVFDVKLHLSGYTYYHTTFSRWVNGSDFTVMIQADNELDNTTILSAWKKSVFLK